MNEDRRSSSPGGDEAKRSIPVRSFGNCRWCGATDVRLQYLMCPNCFSIAGMIPSKVSMLSNRPDVKKRLKEGGATVNNVVPELRDFLSDPKTRFPSERSYQEHWNTMLSQTADFASESDLHVRAVELKSQGEEIPEKDQLKKTIGLEKLLHFMLKVAVLSGTLNLKRDESEDGFCVVCWKSTPSEKHMLCMRCRDELVTDAQSGEEFIDTTPKPRKGMATIDIILRNRKR
ncbi:MAG: hypothetical protein ABIH23_28755 [bacterium]